MKPKRIQRKRSKGWRMPDNAVYVGRGSNFGNPFLITEERGNSEVCMAFVTWLTVDGCHANMKAEKQYILTSLDQLKGKDLACWCSLDKQCHADFLLKLANAE